MLFTHNCFSAAPAASGETTASIYPAVPLPNQSAEYYTKGADWWESDARGNWDRGDNPGFAKKMGIRKLYARAAKSAPAAGATPITTPGSGAPTPGSIPAMEEAHALSPSDALLSHALYLACTQRNAANILAMWKVCERHKLSGALKPMAEWKSWADKQAEERDALIAKEAAYQEAVGKLQEQFRPLIGYYTMLLAPSSDLVHSSFFDDNGIVLTKSECLHAESVLKQIQQLLPAIGTVASPSAMLRDADAALHGAPAGVNTACAAALEEYASRRNFYRATLQKVMTQLDALQQGLSGAAQGARSAAIVPTAVSVGALLEAAGSSVPEEAITVEDGDKKYIAAAGHLRVGRTLYYGPRKKYKGTIIQLNDNETEGAVDKNYRSVHIQNERNGDLEIHDRDVLIDEGNWFIYAEP